MNDRHLTRREVLRRLGITSSTPSCVSRTPPSSGNQQAVFTLLSVVALAILARFGGLERLLGTDLSDR